MKQKIVIKVHMKCKKCRSKALKIAAVVEGVENVGLEGSEKDQVVVIGEQVDSVCLTANLRKKVGHAEIISIAEVKPEEKKKPEAEPAKKPEVHVPIQYIEYYPRGEKFLVIDGNPRPENCCQM